jgi:Flp pilus assembly protein TadG
MRTLRSFACLRVGCTRTRCTSGQRGQALVEMAMSIILLTILSLGIVEFGRMLMIVSVVTHAARDGARSAAAMPATNRNSTGDILDWSGVVTQVNNQIANVTDLTFTIDHLQDTQGGIPMVHITVHRDGGIPYLFAPLLFSGSNALQFSRTVTFRDEGKT